MTSKKLGALALAGALSLFSSAALADVAGGPPGGSGGTTATGGGGNGGNGGGTTTSSSTSTSTGDSKDKGGCSAASPAGAPTSAALFVGLGLLFAIPAVRRRRDRKRRAGRG